MVDDEPDSGAQRASSGVLGALEWFEVEGDGMVQEQHRRSIGSAASQCIVPALVAASRRFSASLSDRSWVRTAGIVAAVNLVTLATSTPPPI